jgi:hypothetical protein
MKGRKELFKMLGIDLGFVANRLLPLEWYDIVHRAYALGFVDRGEWHDNFKGAPPKEGWYVVMIEYDMDGEHDEVPVTAHWNGMEWNDDHIDRYFGDDYENTVITKWKEI